MTKNYIRILFFHIYWKVTSKLVPFFDNVDVAEKVIFKGFPDILINKTGKISIGNSSTLNSSNFGYHINMHSKMKLYADRPGSIIKIGDNCRIHGTCIHAYKSIEIGNNCLIAANTQIIDGNGHQICYDNPAERINTTDNGKGIIIEENVWIAANCIILGGTIIGAGSIISAGSVIKGEVPKNVLWGGNPGKFIKKLEN